MFRRVLLVALLPLVLAACGADRVYAPDEAVQRAAYVSNEPPSITLFTVVRKRGNEGGHSALMINGSQRVLYDGAGSWHHPAIPERYDLHYGINDNIKAFYIDYHARETYDVIEQTVPVSLEVANAAIRRATAQGPTARAFCANSVAQILQDVPGFEGMPRSMFPMRLSRAFSELPGATYRRYQDGDPDTRHNVTLIPRNRG